MSRQESNSINPLEVEQFKQQIGLLCEGRNVRILQKRKYYKSLSKVDRSKCVSTKDKIRIFCCRICQKSYEQKCSQINQQNNQAQQQINIQQQQNIKHKEVTGQDIEKIKQIGLGAFRIVYKGKRNYKEQYYNRQSIFELRSGRRISTNNINLVRFTA